MRGDELRDLCKPILGYSWQKKLARIMYYNADYISKLTTGVFRITPAFEMQVKHLMKRLGEKNNNC